MANIIRQGWDKMTMNKDAYNSKYQDIFWIPTTPTPGSPSLNADDYATPAYARSFGGSDKIEENLNNFRAPIDIPRIKQDMQNWRLAIAEKERQILPYSYIMQQMYMDTALEPHIVSCWNRRLGLTLLKKFKIRSKKNKDLEYEDWSDYFNADWFQRFITHTLEAKIYGYSLISMGNITDNVFNNIVIIRRGNINPDTYLVTPVPRTTNGINFTEGVYKDWHVWVPTPNEHAQSNCGYGLFYVLSPIAIRLKNNTTYNSDYNMKSVAPVMYMTTPEKNEVEKSKKENALRNLGNNGWMIADPDDKLEFIVTANGKGYAAYEDFERRLNQAISKVLLGHADALDSVTGKLGSSQGTKGIAGSPQEQALNDISSQDSHFLKTVIEKDLFRILRTHGIRVNGILLPDDACFEWDNDKEIAEQESTTNDENIKISQMVATLAGAGYKVDLNMLEERTGFKFEITEEPVSDTTKEPTDTQVKNYLDSLKTNDPEFIRFKEKLDSKKKPARVSDPEWEAYKVGREYRKLTKGFDGDRNGLTKEEYAEYIKNYDPNEIEEGDCNSHIGCQCQIINNRWIYSTGTEEPAATTCQNCIDNGTEYNK